MIACVSSRCLGGRSTRSPETLSFEAAARWTYSRRLCAGVLERLGRNPPNNRVGSRRSLMVFARFASCLRLRTTERLEAAPRASHPLINEEGVRLGDSFGRE